MDPVLLVEDNPADADRIANFLHHESDISLKIVRSGTETLELLERETFSCVLLDYRLPDMNGLELLRTLRQLYPELKIIFLAGQEDNRLFLGASTLGVTACISKDKLTESLLTLYIRNLVTRPSPPAIRQNANSFWGVPSLEVYQSLIETMNEGVILVDRQKIIVFANPRVGEIVGCPETELLGKTMSSLFTTNGKSLFSNEWKKMMEGEVRRYESEIQRRDDQTTPVIVSQTPSYHDTKEIQGGLLVITDISKQKEIERRLSQLSITDGLTGLLNRRHFGSLLGTEFQKARRYQYPLSCLMIDLDHFKKCNDSLGHLYGDFVLRETGQLIQEKIRDHDILARYGGEEFILLFPNIPKTGAIDGAERIRSTIEQHPFKYKGQGHRITVSIGISEVADDRAKSTEDLILYADQALYEAKQRGRNKVLVKG